MQSPTSKKIAKTLKRGAPEILRQWEALVRETVPAARHEIQSTVRNSMPHFLDELVDALASPTETSIGPNGPREHARQRACLADYSLEHVVQEYSLLRGTILKVVSETGPIELEDLQVILNTIDVGIAEAAAEYFEQQARTLRESEERFRLLVANVKDYAILMLDPDGRIVSWNLGVEHIKGYTAEESVGKHFSMFYSQEDIDNGKPARGLQTARREGHFHEEGLRVRKDGSTFYADVLITALRDDQGDLRGFAKVTRDITERRALKEELHRRADVLVEANRRKDEFLAMLAHELRNPLAAIVNSAEILRLHPNGNSDVEHAKQIIERQGRHLSRLVDDLLDVSRITKDKITLQKAPIELGHLIDQVAETLRPFIAERQQTISITVPDAPIWLMADFIRLSQVLANLVHNSAKFTDIGGHIELMVWEEDGTAVVRVRDNGAGIDSDLLPYVFDVFTQGGHSHGGRGGLGIGLTLSRRLVQMHDGTISAHSKGQGAGSEFVIRLPILQIDEGEEAGATEEKHGKALIPAPQRILVVDDNIDAASTLALLLEFSGHAVRVAHTGQEALQLAKMECPQAIVLDIGLPDIDGYEVARQLRAKAAFKEVQIVALTGYGQEQDKRQSRDAGIDVHLTKPTDLAALQKVLSEPSVK